jgi:hypothetical protein
MTMPTIDRRTYMLQVVAGTCAAAVGGLALAEDDKPKGKLTEDDPYAKSMGFRLDTNNVDQKRYKKHTPDQQCSKCQLYTGTETDPEAPCSFFGKRIVPATGWCRNFKPKNAPA